MRIKWKPLFSLSFFSCWKHNPAVESEGNFESEFRPIVSSDRPKISNITISQNSKPNEENFCEKREKKCCSA